MTEPIVSWPPPHEQQALLARLAILIRQFGAERFIVVGASAMVGLGVAGLFAVKPKFICSDPECTCIMETALATCPRCGGTIADTIKHARDRLDRLDELREAGRAHPEEP